VAITLGRFAEAARFYGTAERAREAINSPRASDPADEVEHQRYLATARAQADPAAWVLAWEEGRAWPLDQATKAALAMPAEPATDGEPR
jgi:hypothetical protein